MLTSLFGRRRPPAEAFHFLDCGTLLDRELELVAPDASLLPDVLKSCRHPLTERYAPEEAQVTRLQLEQFLTAAPGGLEPGEGLFGRVPSYHFWMRWRPDDSAGRMVPRPISIAGGIGLRIGSTASVELYYGHVGYHVYPPARGHHFAERACRLLFPLARAHGINPLWITCNPENAASSRTCERLGGILVETVRIPKSEPLYARGERQKRRYRIDL